MTGGPEVIIPPDLLTFLLKNIKPSDPIYDHFDMGKVVDIGKIAEIRLARSKLTGEMRAVKIMN